MRDRPIDRRHFLGATLGTVTILGASGLVLGQDRSAAPLDRDMVFEFVGVAHDNLSRTEALLAKEPALARAAWDWGNGDWETGLGGAAHTGSRRIVRYLLANGARMDLFAAAVLGELEIVKAVVKASPAAIAVPGPHGITLLEHARAGGAAAKAVVSYLEELGAKEREIEYEDLPITATEQARYLGVYDSDTRKGLSLEVTLHDGRLHGQPTGSPRLPLFYQGGGIFYAPGAEATLTFHLAGNEAARVTLKQFDLIVTATRRKK